MTSTTSGTETSGPQSSVDQVKDQIQDVTEQAKGKTREQLRSQINERSTQAGDQLVSTAQAMRRTSDQLRQEGNEKIAEVVESLVTRGERLGGYLRDADGDRILRDVESFGRRQPWLMVGGSAVLGFFASRFMKASSSGRYHSELGHADYPSRLSNGDSSVGYSTPPALEPPPSTASPARSSSGDASREGVGYASPGA